MDVGLLIALSNSEVNSHYLVLDIFQEIPVKGVAVIGRIHVLFVHT